MNEDLLGNCRACGHQLYLQVEDCPNCNEPYPSLSEEEVQRYYSNCISCNERLLIRDHLNLKEIVWISIAAVLLVTLWKMIWAWF